MSVCAWGGMADADKGTPEQLNLVALTLPQLQALREQLEQDVQRLTQHLQSLQAAVNRFHTSGLALSDLKEEAEGAPPAARRTRPPARRRSGAARTPAHAPAASRAVLRSQARRVGVECSSRRCRRRRRAPRAGRAGGSAPPASGAARSAR